MKTQPRHIIFSFLFSHTHTQLWGYNSLCMVMRAHGITTNHYPAQAVSISSAGAPTVRAFTRLTRAIMCNMLTNLVALYFNVSF